MENKDTFKITYSAQQREELEQIRSKYLPQQPDKMAQLRALDAAVGRKAAVTSIVLGIIGTLLLGIGMSLIMTDFGALPDSVALLLGSAVGIIGIVAIACAYPVYSRTLKKEREKIAPEILRLTDELMK